MLNIYDQEDQLSIMTCSVCGKKVKNDDCIHFAAFATTNITGVLVCFDCLSIFKCGHISNVDRERIGEVTRVISGFCWKERKFSWGKDRLVTSDLDEEEQQC